MRKILYPILFVVLTVMSSLPVSAQPGGPMRDMFQGQTPPPGAVTMLGRSFFGAMENGFAGSLALIVGADDKNVRQELGLTDAEANSIKLLRVQMLMNAPQYANRFKTMTDETRESVQADLNRDLGRITEHLNTTMPKERRDNVQRLVFQTLGGIDSPVINLNAIEVLELSDAQKGKMKAVFDEMREERITLMERGLGIAEKVVAAGGPRNLSEEDRERLQKEGQELEAQSFATAKKLAERLRQHLTPEQLERERQLIASRPSFLPPLPKQMRQENQESAERENQGPGAGAWRPGESVPGQIQERRTNRFPRGEE
jgi:hypothetical protein